MKQHVLRSAVGMFFAIFVCIFSDNIYAEIIDDINLKTKDNGEVVAAIKFNVPIMRLRYFPPKKSQFLVIYFNILDNVPRDQWQNYESHRSPPSDLIQTFTVTTRDLNTGPKIEIKFNQPTEYSVKAGRDGRSLYIHIKVEMPAQKKGAEQAPLPAVVTAPAAAPPLAPAVAPPLAPAVAAPASSVAELPATSPVPISTKPTVPSDVATAQPKSKMSAATQLGGKDGLPAFPAIELPEKAVDIKPATGEVTLADQIKKANNDAAIMMIKGRDAMLQGEFFAAIEAFNKVLNLPPNKYSQDAQIWIGIAREKSGQIAKAKSEYENYLKLYPQGGAAKWVSDRLAKLNQIMPTPVPSVAVQAPSAIKHTDYQVAEYGSFSMYYYHGASHTDTITTVGNVQSPTSLSVTDQSSLLTNVSMTARAYNDEFDDRLVFQDFYSANFLPGQTSTNRLNAAYFDIRNRIKDYSTRLGRQSAMGGGVLGRFDGISAGYGVFRDYRINAVAGQLSDYLVGTKPLFFGAGVDFGVKSQLGGSFYVIKQTVNGITDREAVGGNLRFFQQGKSLQALLDYDTQFKAINFVTLQGTATNQSGTDFNFLLDQRRTPTLSIRNSVNGTTSSVDLLLQNGWTTYDLIQLAKQRTATSSTAQVGMTNHIREKWQLGSNISAAYTSGLPASGTLNPDFTTGIEGFVPATPSTGVAWTVSENLIGSSVFTPRDVSVCSISYTRSPTIVGTSLQLNNHSFISELWTIDSTFRLYWQTDNMGGKENIISPTLKLGYKARTNLTLETEGGLEYTKNTPGGMPTSTTNRKYYTAGFRWDF